MMDYRMPNMSGIQLTREIRKSSTIPIIIMSGLVNELLKKEVIDARANALYEKPMDIKNYRPLVELIKKLISEHNSN
jgi:CheY-like chemotaxis protein